MLSRPSMVYLSVVRLQAAAERSDWLLKSGSHFEGICWYFLHPFLPSTSAEDRKRSRFHFPWNKRALAHRTTMRVKV